MKFKKILKWAAIILGVLILVAILWAVLPYTVMDEAETALEGNDYVPVTIGDNIYFEPSEINDYNLGLILYPGTRVNSEAYAPLALSLAEKGYFVAIAQMPLDLSVLSIDKASGITKKYADIEHWIIGGHSMGGAMAAFYANDNLDVIDGLFFLGSYPSDSTDLSQSDLEVISIFGEFDYVSDTAEVESKKKYLPENTEYVLIEGGNHSQFGWYGPQDGDGAATISYKEQHEIIVDALDSFIVDRF